MDMSGSPIITGLMIFFSVTTIAVIAWPLYKLAPSWIERNLYRKIAFHRDAAAVLAVAMERAHGDSGRFERLALQHDYHTGALLILVPHETVATPAPVLVDAAA
jgi:hypothetical protein